MIAVLLNTIFVVWVSAPISVTGKRMISTKRGMDDWRPMDYGDPMANDPTLVYVPPVLDPVHYGIHTQEPMWPIRSWNRLQTGNHNGKSRPTLPPEGAGYFNKTRKPIHSSHAELSSRQVTQPAPPVKTLVNSFIRNDKRGPNKNRSPVYHRPVSKASMMTSTTSAPIPAASLSRMTLTETTKSQEMTSRTESRSDGSVNDESRIDRSDGPLSDISLPDSDRRDTRKRPDFQFVQQVHSRVRMYGTLSGKSAKSK